MSTQREYGYPVWGTQGGGLVREVKGTYIFVEKPDCPGLDVGDDMPEEWGIIPANARARNTMPDNPFQADSVEAGLFEALGELHKCPGCGKMLDISLHYRHQEYGCQIAEAVYS